MSGSYILGVSAFYHDSAAALVRDGEIIAAAQEERFSRKKHDPRFPANAINFCLAEAFIDAAQIEAVVFYDNSALTLDRAVQIAVSAHIVTDGHAGYNEQSLGQRSHDRTSTISIFRALAS